MVKKEKKTLARLSVNEKLSQSERVILLSQTKCRECFSVRMHRHFLSFAPLNILINKTAQIHSFVVRSSSCTMAVKVARARSFVACLYANAN